MKGKKSAAQKRKHSQLVENASIPSAEGRTNFFSLPLEIREYIYTLAIQPASDIIDPSRYGNSYANLFKVYSHEEERKRRRIQYLHPKHQRTGLLRVNKQFYSEGSSILYTRPTFLMPPFVEVQDVESFLKAIPTAKHSQIRKIMIEVLVNKHGDSLSDPRLLKQLKTFTWISQKLPGLQDVEILFDWVDCCCQMENCDDLVLALWTVVQRFRQVPQIKIGWCENHEIRETTREHVSQALERVRSDIRIGNL